MFGRLTGGFLSLPTKIDKFEAMVSFFRTFHRRKVLQSPPLKKKGWLDLELCYLLNLKSFTIFSTSSFQISAYFPSFAVVAYLPSLALDYRENFG